MRKIIITEDQYNRINKIVTEQVTTNTLTPEELLNNALKKGCIGKISWFTPDQTQPIRKTKSGKYAIIGKGTNGQTYLFYSDMTVANVNTGAKKTWDCPDIDKPIVELDANQTKVLEILKPLGWFTSPVPTDVEVEDGTFIKDNLTNPNDATLKKYSKWFASYTNGYPIYKKSVKQTSNVGTPDITKTSQEAKLETKSTQDLSQSLKTINQDLSTDLSFDACTQLVDTYFELAKKGQADKNIPTYQSKIYACNNTHRSKWKEGTKDKLRWLSGNEEQAKQIFGLFKKFPRIGNVGDTPGRKEWRLRQLPPIE